MKKEVELFDKRFVHFMWDDELAGKECFVADNIDDLIFAVRNDGKCAIKTNALRYSGNKGLPFHAYMLGANCSYSFAYYDPNYGVKKAYNKGKAIQFKSLVDGSWCDCGDMDGLWRDTYEYRIKPEEKKWIAYLARQKNGLCYLTACREDTWEDAQKDYGAKTKLFVGSAVEATEWYESRQKFVEVIKAWEDGKTIQFLSRQQQLNGEWINVWYDCIGWLTEPKFLEEVEYRVKPEEKKKYRPYSSSAEMIADFIDRFKVNCPSYCEPLIWVKHKNCADHHYLITGFASGACVRMGGSSWRFDELLKGYTYLDGSPCGMEVKE